MVVSFDDFNPLLTFIGGVIGISAPFIGFIFYLVKTSKKSALAVKKEMLTRIDALDVENAKRIENTRKESVKSIEENKQVIASVQKNLCDQIFYNTEKITSKIDQRDKIYEKTIEKIDTKLEKIDEKLDAHADAVTRNTARLEGHDERIDNIERKIYKTPSKF